MWVQAWFRARELCRRLAGQRVPAVLLVIVALASQPGRADDLDAQIARLVDSHRGQVAVAIKHLRTGKFYGHRENEPMPTASLIKFPVMVTAYQQAEAGDLDLNRLVTLRAEDCVPGSGILTTHFSPGTQISIRDAIRLMIVYSDNTATNLVLDAIGIEATGRLMEQMGMPRSRIHSKVFRGDTSIDPPQSRRFGLGCTTAMETIRLYEMLHREQLVSKSASLAMLDHLRHCADDAKLVRGLPMGTTLAHKGGATSAVRCDAGLIESPSGPWVICVLTSENADRVWNAENAGEKLCAAIAETAWRHFQEAASTVADPDTPAAERMLRLGASGELVEALQRTLNARLDPSPDLSVDGDFGPMTEAAVRRFQRWKQLEPDGVVNSATWQALGTLLEQDAPVPDPQTVNAESLPLAPADSLDAPPWVTAKAWVVADARDGKILWGHRHDQPLDQASTTKIMTAYLVLKLAERDAAESETKAATATEAVTKANKVLAETVRFSRRADETKGSTAGIREGEQLSVEELLYGLLLPSGNDAAVALAEHFGSRFEPPATSPDESDPLLRFVAEMNRQAERLELQHTHFANPHGLTAEGHQSSAGDLVRLSWHALQLPHFQKYIGTRQHGCMLESEAGYRRNVLWKNTNQLLATSGYSGVKTGTTQAAGACLVSLGQRGDDRLLVAVLGAAASQARYTDTRNLFRWSWLQRAATAP
jgi:D-alanyl-D-alanine carboxypeptidase (penicillin-binding protein 5/6)